ncbi:MAG TPA: lysylphosphatidylglycerol synthase transmembrane domain-containing protein [Thermoanaerobaculia bacterium]|nr:lysylphosphatidylglycerol synthase transmembrane domain-containing protein [Thermoanaerobaculia bacterium]
MVPLLLGVLVVVGLALTANPHALARSLRDFDLWLLVPVLALSLFNYGLRYLRWEFYLKRLGCALGPGRGLAIFLVGFLLSVTPGRAGELGKAWLVRELGGGRAMRVVSAVLAERVTDVLGTFVLIAIGALPLPGGPWIAAAFLAGVVAIVVVLTWRRGAEWAFAILGKMPVMGPRVPHLVEMVDRLRELLSPELAIGGILVASVAWAAEGYGFWLVVRNYAPKAGLLVAIFNYTAASILGGLSMLPGGLGAAEGSLTALLHEQGLATADASSITLVIRAATLWFSVLFGVLALPFVARWLAARGEGPGMNARATTNRKAG